MYEEIYEPAEDSFLMERTLKHYLRNKDNLKITEVGVGSGFVFSELMKTFPNNKYSATDINPEAIKETKKRISSTANIIQGNLLDLIKEKQNIISFNTPYLPCEDGDKFENLSLKDKAIYGGKHGYEIIFRFINQLHEKLETNGKVFMLFSSLSKEEKIKEKLEAEGFSIEEIIREKHFMEELIIYIFKKSNQVKEIEDLQVSNISYLTKGKHSKIYQGRYNKNKVIIKCEDNSYIEKEIFFLEKLQKEAYVPKLYKHKKGIIVMEKCKGIIIKEYLDKESKENILATLQKIVRICIKLDNLGYQKFELTNPYKHIFIDKENIKFIDFERTIHAKNPKNTTQFLQYIRRNTDQFKKKDIIVDKIKLLEISKKYKEKSYQIKIEEFLNF